jgi:multiple sugar transport system permease protein
MSLKEGNERISYETRQRVWNVIEGPMIVHLVLGLSVFLVVSPLLWELLTSLKTNEAVNNLNFIPADPTLASYYDVLIERSYWKAMRNSLIISSTTTVIVLLLSVPAGYAFSRFRFPFDNVIFIAVLFSRLFPPIGLIVPYFQIMTELNLLNTLPGVIIAQVYLWLPLMVYIIRNFFISIPQELDESARVDGCTRVQAFRHVVLPLARPGIAAVAILTFLYSWREFLFSLIVTRTLEAQPIAVAVTRFFGDVSVSWASLAAASTLALIPTAIIVFTFQRYIVSGLTAGALKQ